MTKVHRRSFLLACVLAVGACEAPGGSARDVLRKAIEAHGGEKNLAKTLTGRIKANIEGSLGEVSCRVRLVETFQLPSQYKRVIDGEVAGKKEHMEYAFTDGRGWLMRNGDPAKEMTAAKLSLEQHWHTMPVLLTRLLTDGSELTRIPEVQADGKTLTAVKFVKGEIGAELFFDRQTGLLARSKRNVHLPLAAGNPAGDQEGEVAYSDYKDVAGVKYPMTISASAGNKTSFNIHVTGVQFLDGIEPAEFSKP